MSAEDVREAWEQSTELCVSCPNCAFTFDSTHTDQDGGYSCPLCAEIHLEARLAEVERLRAKTSTQLTQVCSERDRAEARVVELTADRAEFAGDWRLAVERAEAAEARLAEVERERDEAGMLPEEGLERIASLACDLLAALRPWEMHGPTVRSSAARLTIALAALPLQAAPKQDEAEGEA